MFATWILFGTSILLIVSSAHTNRLPPIYPQLGDSIAFLSTATSAGTHPDTHSSFYPPPKGPSIWDNMASLPTLEKDLALLGNKLKDSLDPLDFTFDEDPDLISQSPLNKRNPRNHHHNYRVQDLRHHFDVCVVSYDLKDLGGEFYPRYIQTANCRNQLPESLQDHITCKPIHYNVQVLTQRKSTDPEDVYQNSMPEALKDWRFVHVPVNVGCHCTVSNVQ